MELDEARTGLGIHTPSFSKNYELTALFGRIEKERQRCLDLSQSGSAVDLVSKLIGGSRYLIELVNNNQDIVEQVLLVTKAKNQRFRGRQLGSFLNSIEKSVAPTIVTGAIYEAGKRAVGRWLGRKRAASDTSTLDVLCVSPTLKNFIMIELYLASGYHVFLLNTPSEIKDMLEGAEAKNDFQKLYDELCGDIPLDEATESLSFVLRLTKCLNDFDGDDLLDEERSKVTCFLRIKDRMAKDQGFWTSIDSISLDSRNDEDEDSNRYFVGDRVKQKDSMELMTFMVCGNQIEKVVSKESLFKNAEEFRSLVLRSSVWEIRKKTRPILMSEFFEAGKGVRSSVSFLDRLEKFYNFCTSRIVDFEKDLIVAFDLDDGVEDYERIKSPRIFVLR